MESITQTISRHAQVLAVLTDPDYTVPAVPADVPPAGVAWLRAHVARFSSGPDHHRRRAAAIAELDRLDPAVLRRAARDRAASEQAGGEGPAGGDGATAGRGNAAGGAGGDVAWSVPVALLAAGLGATDPDGTVADVRAAAGSYHPHTEITPEADAAVARLVAAFGGTPDERTATRIGLLIQACDATAALIQRAATHPGSLDGVLAETLRHDPPAAATRRVAPTGGTILLDLAAANRDPAVFPDPDTFDPGRDETAALGFGAGQHACPGSAAALALAAGVLDALR